MNHSIPHDLGEDQAKRVAEKALAAYAERFAEYSPKVIWSDPKRAQVSFSVKGLSLSGLIQIQSRSIDIDLDVPFMLRPFKGKAMEVIEREFSNWINKAKAGKI